ncbi:NACHT, LRR and PYD domains-containing protein 6 [Sorex fumeus]|uniref:NACHT, LRR and PYD domains-containing protein 6 n=1 Tax=Sorex fumeus TaxID=62283 RepID=UPI0024AD59F8|nr:NACHT, LRR and PYD domains-containing protein 6 [Sorex fumeus]
MDAEGRCAAVASELLLAALEDLSQEQLKRFCLKLRDEPVEGRSIPRGRLEHKDAVELAQQLIQFYGPEPALDVALRTLKRTDVRDVAAQLKEQRLQRLGPGSAALLSVSEYMKKYREHVLREHAKVKERNARSVKISKRFTKLLIAPETPEPADEAPGGAADEPEQERARRSDTHTFNRLFRRDHEGQRPLTVVLQGPAGIGKTMAAKKILYDWAAGKLYHGKVDFAFFLPCRELLERPAACSLADLLLEQCRDRGAPLQQMLQRPERLLFILDGADEVPDGPACSDPFQPAEVARVLGGLLSKALLPDARLLVTSRAATASRVQGRLCSPQCAEVRGFSDKDKKKYFYKFFGDEGKAERAYRLVKENETLFSLCFVPFVCWIVCTVLHQQLEGGQDLSRASKTTTAVYLLFTVSFLSPGAPEPKMQGEMRKLSRLAREGVLGGKAQFSERDLDQLELRGSKAQMLFLIKKELPGVLEPEVIYQFMDQSFQEFFAALSYLLEDEGAPGAAPEGVRSLLHRYKEAHGQLPLTVRFLFGLLNTQRMQEVEHHFGCVVSPGVKQDVLKWVQGQGHGQGTQRAAPEEIAEAERQSGQESEDLEESEEGEEGLELCYPLELLYCLYESQEPPFVRQALQGFPQLTLERVRLSRMDVTVLSYCIRCCPPGQALQLTACRLAVAPEKKKKSLVKRLTGSLGGYSSSAAPTRKPPISLLRPLCEAITNEQCGLSSLTLSYCKIPDSVCQDLAEAVRRAPALSELALLHSGLSKTGMYVLSEGLAWPHCRVQVLRVQEPSAPDALQYLLGMLRQSPALTTLDLSGCQLSEPLVTYLCGVLQHPECRLQTLSLTSVELKEASLQELQFLRTAKPGLVITHPALDHPPEPPRRLVLQPSCMAAAREGLQSPRCPDDLTLKPHL